MSPKEIKYIVHWENKYAKGRFQYLMPNALIWGTFLALLVCAIELALGGQLSFWNVLHKLFTWHFLTKWLLSITLVLVFSLLLWYKARKKYTDLKDRQEAEDH